MSSPKLTVLAYYYESWIAKSANRVTRSESLAMKKVQTPVGYRFVCPWRPGRSNTGAPETTQQGCADFRCPWLDRLPALIGGHAARASVAKRFVT
jgi:hypothetical protein